MRSGTTVGLMIGLGLLMTGCSGSLGDKLGLGKRAPDEFAVVKRQPLIVPPDFDLRPPDPNARGPLPGRADVRARGALTGVPVEQRLEGSGSATTSAGETALIRRSAEVQPDPAVRSRMAEEGGGAAPVEARLFEQLTRPDAAAVPDGRATPTAGEEPPADELTVIQRSSSELEDQ